MSDVSGVAVGAVYTAASTTAVANRNKAFGAYVTESRVGAGEAIIWAGLTRRTIKELTGLTGSTTGSSSVAIRTDWVAASTLVVRKESSSKAGEAVVGVVGVACLAPRSADVTNISIGVKAEAVKTALTVTSFLAPLTSRVTDVDDSVDHIAHNVRSSVRVELALSGTDLSIIDDSLPTDCVLTHEEVSRRGVLINDALLIGRGFVESDVALKDDFRVNTTF